MKNTSTLFILLIILLTNSCSCKKEVSDPLSSLPPETHTGANTFGCLINGNAFIPDGPSLFGPSTLKCAYQYINKGYYFQLSANNQSSNPEDFYSIGIGTDSLKIRENGAYQLTNINIPNLAFGGYNHYTIQNLYTKPSYTTDKDPGNLTITKFDSIHQVVSGTFWFNVISERGDTIKITKGRFDMQYTR